VATPLGYVALFPPMLRPTLVKFELHLEAFCLAEFEFPRCISTREARDQ
jgi:hypothetical protein